MYNPFSIKGKTLLITGASSGIGRSIAIECSKMGANVHITGRNEQRLNECFALLQGEQNAQYVYDLEVDADIDALCDQLPALDGIVHVAGRIKHLPFQFANRSEISDIMNINFLSPSLLSNALLRRKKIVKGASIVFISSISGNLCSSNGGAIYSASKAAINGIVKGMALDLASKQIRVNTIMPGMIETNLLDNSPIAQADLEIDRKRYPLKRYGKPEEVAYAAIYLLSDASEWVTGTNLLIDGGYTLL